MDLQSWDSWGADDVSFNRANGPGGQGEASNRFGHRNQQDPTEEEEVDYFQDMMPEYKKAAKVWEQILLTLEQHIFGNCRKLSIYRYK